MRDESCTMFNLNRFDGLLVVFFFLFLLARRHNISEIFDRILKPVYFSPIGQKCLPGKCLNSFDRKCSEEFPIITFCTIGSFEMRRLDQSFRFICLEGRCS